MNADVLHQDMYAYDIYAEYLNKIEHYSINSTINSLSIRYYKQNIPFTMGTVDELDVIVTPGYSRAYDIFDFTPVLESQPLTYTNENDETNQGVIRRTQGTMTIMAVIEPLPGDVLNFYQHGSTNEFFSVSEVNFVHAVKDLNIYQIEFHTANWSVKSVEDMTIINHYYFVKEFRKFYDSTLYESYATLLESRNTELESINIGYDCVGTKYDDKITLSNGDIITLPESKVILLNSTLRYLNDKVQLPIKYIDGYDIQRGPDGLVIQIMESDTYIPDPNYVTPPYDPNVPYDPYAGQIQSVVMEKVRVLQDLYYDFINYQDPLDGNIDTTGIKPETKIFKEDAVEIIRDLDGNTINN